MANFLGIPNFEYIGGIIGVIIFGIIIWMMLRSSGSGRLGEERQEEKETKALEKDEVIEEAAQLDEKSQCDKMKKLFQEIMDILRQTERGETADKVILAQNEINVRLTRLKNENMSVERSIGTFRELDASIKEFLSHLPINNKQINKLIEEIKWHQERCYEDLVKEMKINRDKKLKLIQLLGEVSDEESGSGQLKVA